MSIKLSERMMAIVRMVSSGHDAINNKRVVADIGCDHGFVSIYLIQNHLADKVLAMDVAEGPLLTAMTNVAEEGLGDKIELRLSNGFEKMKMGETDAAIIAGMGGQLIIRILKNGRIKLEEGYELVLSPQSDVRMVREYLRKEGILIVDEDMICEDGKYYNIIKAVVSDEHQEYTEDEVYDTFGEYLIKKKSPVLISYIDKEIEKKQGIYCRLSKKDTENTVNRLFEINKELKLLEKAREMIIN